MVHGVRVVANAIRIVGSGSVVMNRVDLAVASSKLKVLTGLLLLRGLPVKGRGRVVWLADLRMRNWRGHWAWSVRNSSMMISSISVYRRQVRLWLVRAVCAVGYLREEG